MPTVKLQQYFFSDFGELLQMNIVTQSGIHVFSKCILGCSVCIIGIIIIC